MRAPTCRTSCSAFAMLRVGSGSRSLSGYAAAMPGLVESLGRQQTAPGHRDHRYARRASRDPGRRLAVQGLFVQRAFTGDHQLRACQLFVEADEFQQQVDPGSSCRAEPGQARHSRSRLLLRRPGASARSRPVAAPSTFAQRARRSSSSSTCAGLRALLRSERRRGAVRSPSSGLSTSQASTISASASRPSIVDISTVATSASAPPPGGNAAPAASNTPAPSACNMPGAAIGARAAADAEHDRAATRSQRGANQFARAETGRGHRREPSARQPHQPARGRRLHDRDAIAHRDHRVERLAGRPVRGHVDRVKPAASAASTVPSPPSATGTVRTGWFGRTSWMPWASAVATCSAVSEPLNLSGATSTCG